MQHHHIRNTKKKELEPVNFQEQKTTEDCRWSQRKRKDDRQTLEKMRTLTMPACSASLVCLLLLLLCGLLGGLVLCICPSVCSCSGGHRVVDCSSRGLTKLPSGLQHNIRFLNLSFNSLQGLDGQLSHYAHLRTLDLSYNRLDSLPPALPRSLWDLRAAGNHLRTLDKNDTAYHWNLKVLDLSDNELERVVFINNTLLSLQALNLSYNRFWTVPTNIPHNLESIDLSHNYLVQILPGSLDRLPKLAQFYLHANRFSWLSEGIFDKLNGLEVITLGDNPWACEEEENIARLLRWAEQTPATVFGCPCYTRPICGKTHLATTGKHSALFTEPPLWINSRGERYDGQSLARTADVTSSYQAKSENGIYQGKRGVNESEDHILFVLTSSTSFSSFSTRTSTAQPQSSSKKPKVANSLNKGHGLHVETKQTVTLMTVVMTTAFTTF